MTDQHEQRVAALDELGRRFDEAIARLPRRRRRWRRPAAIAGCGLVLVAAPAAAVVTDGFDFGRDVPRAGTPGGPPAPATGLPDDRTVPVMELVQSPAGRETLRRRLATVGIDLIVTERVVAAAADGRVFGVQLPRRARMQDHRLVLEDGVGGAVRVTLGRAAGAGEAVDPAAGLTLPEARPEVARAVDRRDPVATGRRLAELGYAVRWRLVIDNPAHARDPSAPVTGWKDVAAPPDGTVVLSVLDGASAGPDAGRTDDLLLLELAPDGSAVARSHPG